MSKTTLNRILVRLTFIDGLFFALMVASTESYALYHFTKKGLTGLELGILSTLPLLLASLTQLFIPRFFGQRSMGAGLLGSMLIQLAGIIGLFYCSFIPISFVTLLASLALYWVGGQNAAPFWLDYVSQKVPEGEFPRYLGSRNTFVITFTMLFFLLFAYFLEKRMSIHTLFGVGCAARMVSCLINLYLIVRYPLDAHLPHKVMDDEQRGIQRLFQTVMSKFVFWGGLFRFAVAICSPFFLPYMINELKLSTPSYVWLSAVPFMGRAIFQKNWVAASEKGKSYYGVQIATFFIAFLPVLWTFHSGYAWLVFLQFLSGIFWGGLELTQVLMLQAHSYGNSRKIYGLQQAVYTTFTASGALLGGYLLDHHWSTFEVFNLSTGIRLIVAMALVFNLRNFNITKLSWQIGTEYLVTVLSLRPSLGDMIRAVPLKIGKHRGKKRP